jgi:hypothetical protein
MQTSYGLKHDHRPPGPSRVSLLRRLRGDVANLERLLENLCELVRVQRRELLWLQPDLSPRPWALYRLDDNGNRFLMSLLRTISLSKQHFFMSKGAQANVYC